uniref:Uncharacterized protein n=1 Tax=Caenorhabditis japonica TaxID=281687 RepID=A0A8R1IG72_CAEJA
MFAPAPRKRELLAEPSLLPAKKSRLDRESGRLQQQQTERKFKRRKLQEVIDELVVRVENNDRQLTNNLIRELDSEHVRVVRPEDFETSTTLMMKACLSAKVDSVASKVFNCLMGIFSRGSFEDRQKFILSLEEDADGLFSKNNLDAGVLLIYTIGLNENLIRVEQVPEKVQLIARRSLAYSSLSSTANRTTAIEFLVAFCVSSKNSDLEKSKECEKQLCRLGKDRDYRVRKAASDAILRLAKSGYFLEKSTYKVAKAFIKDQDSTVRITAIRLLIYFANRIGKGQGKPKETELEGTTPLTDDAFSAICDAMN